MLYDPVLPQLHHPLQSLETLLLDHRPPSPDRNPLGYREVETPDQPMLYDRPHHLRPRSDHPPRRGHRLRPRGDHLHRRMRLAELRLQKDWPLQQIRLSPPHPSDAF